MSGVRRGYAPDALGQLHYVEAGAGPPLLLIGETPRGHRFFDPLLPLLAPTVRVIAVDLPGLGNSHRLPEPVSIRAMARCMVEFLGALGIERVDVFGMHTGNKVAAALAADWPDRVDRLAWPARLTACFRRWRGGTRRWRLPSLGIGLRRTSLRTARPCANGCAPS